MKSSRSLTVVWLLLLFPAFGITAQTPRITATEAKDHVGEVKTVCGKVASTRYAAQSKGQPTFLNLDEPYPTELFTIVIWAATGPLDAWIPKGVSIGLRWLGVAKGFTCF